MRYLIIGCLGIAGRLVLKILGLAAPLYQIRIGILGVPRIGILLPTVDFYLRRRLLEQRDPEATRGHKRQLDVFIAAPHTAANRYVLKMLARRIFILESRFLNSLFCAAQTRCPDSPVWVEFGDDGRTEHHVWKQTKTQLLALTDEERNRGREFLRSVGLGPHDKFICFAVRDKAYLNVTAPPEKQHPPRPPDYWRYHDYRDVDIETYRLMAERLAGEGYWVFRMGAIVDRPISWDHERIIDYSTRYRSEFLDIYLLASCEFYIGDTAGILAIPCAFDVPIGLANLVPFMLSGIPSLTIFVPRRFRRSGAAKLLTARQMLELGIDRFTITEEFEGVGAEPVANTPEEIYFMAKELEAKATGTWVDTPEDRALRERFWSLFPADQKFVGTQGQISSAFLKRNEEFLD